MQIMLTPVLRREKNIEIYHVTAMWCGEFDTCAVAEPTESLLQIVLNPSYLINYNINQENCHNLPSVHLLEEIFGGLKIWCPDSEPYSTFSNKADDFQ